MCHMAEKEYDEGKKLQVFLNFVKMAKVQKDIFWTNEVHCRDRIERLNAEMDELGETIKHLFSSETLNRLKAIRILDQSVMTIENLTSFNRMQEENTFLIFLSGYHNSVKQQFIKKIYDANPGLAWQHFGDIDPDGFYIIENLRRGTGIDFNPVYMNVEVLKKYKDYTKSLTGNDIRKATALIQNDRYRDIMGYMLDTGEKLEQEIVSWLGRKDGFGHRRSVTQIKSS